MKPLHAFVFVLVAIPLLPGFLSAQPVQDAIPDHAVNGTTGTPLGGFGAGAVKFDANTGTFAAMLRPPADANDFTLLKNAGFALFTQRAGSWLAWPR